MSLMFQGAVAAGISFAFGGSEGTTVAAATTYTFSNLALNTAPAANRFVVALLTNVELKTLSDVKFNGASVTYFTSDSSTITAYGTVATGNTMNVTLDLGGGDTATKWFCQVISWLNASTYYDDNGADTLAGVNTALVMSNIKCNAGMPLVSIGVSYGTSGGDPLSFTWNGSYSQDNQTDHAWGTDVVSVFGCLTDDTDITHDLTLTSLGTSHTSVRSYTTTWNA